MSGNEFENIFDFLHCCDNSQYPTKGQPGQSPKKKLGFTYEKLAENFLNVWSPHKNIAIDEAAVPFKGRIHFKCYNPNKPDKNGIKTFKVSDSSNAYCCVLDIYVGETDDGTKASKFGKTHELITKLLSSYLNKGYVIHMDNFYSSPYLFYNLLSLKTHACGTARPQNLLQEIASAKFKVRGESITMNYDNKIVAHCTLDRKHVTLLSTAYNTQPVLTGKLHWKTKEPIESPTVIHMYNKNMGWVDCNDQLMKYSPFSHMTCWWWKKVLFRLLNIAIANAYITYSEWVALK